MTVKKLIGMALALILLVTVAILQKHSGSSASSGKSGKQTTLFEGIDLNAVTSINVDSGSNSVALVKSAGKWTVESLYGYPAAFNTLADTIRSAAQAELGSPVRSGNVAESEYGLGADAKKIELKEGDKTVASIEVGSNRKSSDPSAYASQFYTRLADDSAIYLVDYDFGSFSDKSEDWIDKDLVQVPSKELIEIKTDDVDLTSDGSGWKLADLDPATEEFQAPVARRLQTALQYLYCASVADPAKSDKDLGFDTPARYTARTGDGFTYRVTFGATTDKGRYVRLAVEYAKPKPPAAPAADAEPAAQDEYKKALDTYNTTTAANAKKAVELNAKLSNWTYLINTYTANGMTIPRSELVKAKTSSTENADVSPPQSSEPTTVTSAPVTMLPDK